MPKWELDPNANYCLSIRQPWAYAIFNLGKDVENRTWQTEHRGRLYIHTSKKVSMREFAEGIQAISNILPQARIPSDAPSLAFGAIIGYVELVDIYPPNTRYFSPWQAANQYSWVITSPTLLPTPVPCRGQLNLWDCTDQLSEIK